MTRKVYSVTRWRCSICHKEHGTKHEAQRCYDSHTPTKFGTELDRDIFPETKEP